MIRGLDEELRTSKYAHIERERRFLVDPDKRPDLIGYPSILIEDRYIDGTRLRLRRMTMSDTGRVILKLAKKYDGVDPLARPMVTVYLTDAEFALLENLPARPLVKRRYPLGDFSIDLFEGALAGLELTESEQDDETRLAELTLPDWVGTEVSHDSRFEGGNLVMLDAIALAELMENVV